MSGYLKVNPWGIVEDKFVKERVESSESLFSIGNGSMGGRANFEEHYSGESLQGSYVGGVYYPDKTRVGWWKNGYPEYFAKVLNSAFWVGVDVWVDGEMLDLNRVEVVSFNRRLMFNEGVLHREMRVKMLSGVVVDVKVSRFVSLKFTELGVVRYSVTPVSGSANIKMRSYVNGDILNSDANYSERFWDVNSISSTSIVMTTRKSNFTVAWYQYSEFNFNGATTFSDEYSMGSIFSRDMAVGEVLSVEKYVGVASSLNHKPEKVERGAKMVVIEGISKGYEALEASQIELWSAKMRGCDVVIEGDDAAQQGIRYSIFMLLQTYNGEDSRLNIGPKGFTGEKYGGGTYWDTEAYCLPFYLSTMGEDVARNLLIYRYNQLSKAIDNAAKLGFKDGAALFPMVTMNGEECHNEWEITFEEIHRNGAIAYAVYNFVKNSGNSDILASHCLEVLIAISRFWAQRVTYSTYRNKYVILGVTGPNEYENNVNNNWYTNFIASWCLEYTMVAIDIVKKEYSEDWCRIAEKCGFDADKECIRWADIVENIHLPYDKYLDVILQQDLYLDKEQLLAKDVNPAERPINQHWSWDRILRSSLIKQADVLQGLYFFRDKFSSSEIARNFDFYESRTLHESSLSPSVHSILAAYIGDSDKAHELFLLSSRLDLDDLNHEIDEGLHITSMAGSWLAVVEGFGGMQVVDDKLHFKPNLYYGWKSLQFSVKFRGRELSVVVTGNSVDVSRVSGDDIVVVINGVDINV